MYVCIYIYIYVYMYVCMCVCVEAPPGVFILNIPNIRLSDTKAIPQLIVFRPGKH